MSGVLSYLHVLVSVIHANDEGVSVNPCRSSRTKLDGENLMTVGSYHAQRRLYREHTTHTETIRGQGVKLLSQTRDQGLNRLSHLQVGITKSETRLCVCHCQTPEKFCATQT